MGLEQIRQLKEAAAARPKKKQFTGIIKTEDFAKTMPKNIPSHPFGNVKSGNYETSKGSTYFRSKWEANYALYLDFLIKQNVVKDWEFEADTFFFDKIKSGTKKYIPDFKVTMIDGSVEYHEVKGFTVARDRTKIRRMAKYFPEIKLVQIDKTFYNDLYKKFKTVLHFY